MLVYFLLVISFKTSVLTSFPVEENGFENTPFEDYINFSTTEPNNIFDPSFDLQDRHFWYNTEKLFWYLGHDVKWNKDLADWSC